MFTGLIEAIGTIGRLDRRGAGATLRVESTWPDPDLPATGDSIAVDGVCLTVVEPSEGGFTADLSPETIDRTLLSELRTGSGVNLERAIRLGDRLGGHIVQGHVDSVIRVVNIRPEGGFQRWRLSLPTEQAREVALKGSVTLNGISLTVADLGPDWFEVALIPVTLETTTFGRLQSGARVHLETDVLAKYVARRLEGAGGSALEEVFGGGGGA
jgi:riboflavin synthase